MINLRSQRRKSGTQLNAYKTTELAGPSAHKNLTLLTSQTVSLLKKVSSKLLLNMIHPKPRSQKKSSQKTKKRKKNLRRALMSGKPRCASKTMVLAGLNAHSSLVTLMKLTTIITLGSPTQIELLTHNVVSPRRNTTTRETETWSKSLTTMMLPTRTAEASTGLSAPATSESKTTSTPSAEVTSVPTQKDTTR